MCASLGCQLSMGNVWGTLLANPVVLVRKGDCGFVNSNLLPCMNNTLVIPRPAVQDETGQPPVTHQEFCFMPFGLPHAHFPVNGPDFVSVSLDDKIGLLAPIGEPIHRLQMQRQLRSRREDEPSPGFSCVRGSGYIDLTGSQTLHIL